MPPEMPKPNGTICYPGHHVFSLMATVMGAHQHPSSLPIPRLPSMSLALCLVSLAHPLHTGTRAVRATRATRVTFCLISPTSSLHPPGVKISLVIHLSNLNIYSNFNLFLFLSWHSLSKHSSNTVISGVLFPLLFSYWFWTQLQCFLQNTELLFV